MNGRHFHKKRTALIAALALGLVRCGDSSPLDVTSPSADLIGPIFGGEYLVRCTPLPADSATQTVGPAGGTIEVGPHTLVIPAGALEEAVTITAVTPSDSVNQIRFGPEGLTFESQVLLTMSYANCGPYLPLPKQVAYTTAGGTILEYLLSVDHLLSQKVTGYVWHFSNYAVAW